MAGRTQGCAAIGCLGLCFMLLVAMCTGGESDAEADWGTRRPPPPIVNVPPPAPAADLGEWFYAHGNLNVRSAPRADATLVRTLRRGDRMELGSKDENGWARLFGGATAEEYVYRASDLVRVEPPDAEPSPERRRSGSASRELHRGPRGGCYYYTGSGNKQYVDRSLCN